MSIMNFALDSIATFLLKSKYYIPDYQREYSWSDEEITDFWMDLDDSVNENRDSHFFGQIVVHNDCQSSNKFLIDGQQRICTSVILFAVFRDIFQNIVDQINLHSARNKVEDIRTKYIGRWSENENELMLMLGKVNKEFFVNNIQKSKPDFSTSNNLHKSNEKIKYAYTFLFDQLNQFINTKGARQGYDIICKYYDKFKDGFKVMYIETNDINEAFVIFETLNARGKDLETADLLKNHLFRTSGSMLDMINEKWTRLTDNLENVDTTKYLRYYWNAKHKFVREKDLFKKLKDLINTPKQCEDFIIETLNMSELFKALINPDSKYYDDKTLNSTLINLRITSARSFYPVILAMEISGFHADSISLILSAIECLIVRNCVVAERVANRYELLFANIAYDVSEKNLTDKNDIKKLITNEILTDDEFEYSFSMLSINSPIVAKYILREINDFGNIEMRINPDDREIHLEHILPKSKNNWPHIDEDTHRKYLYRIGNLTLLAGQYNRNASNKRFSDKKIIYNDSKIAITKSLTDYEDWNQESINHRQKKLFENAKKRWAL